MIKIEHQTHARFELDFLLGMFLSQQITQKVFEAKQKEIIERYS